MKERKKDRTEGYTNKMREKKERLREFFQRSDYVPMKFKEIASLFQVPKKEREALSVILGDLIKEGVLLDDGEGKFERVGSDVVIGTYMATKKGFGFLRRDGEEDLYIPFKYTENAFDGDTVMAKIFKSRMQNGKSREAKIIKIVERATKFVVGTFTRKENFGFVIPDHKKIEFDLYIPKNGCKNIPKGYKVVAEVTDYGDFKRNPEGKIIEVLGDAREKGMDILSVARAYGIEDAFPLEVLEQIPSLPKRVKKAEMEGRLDLREVCMVTIDSESAKDLDDAVSVMKEMESDGTLVYHLGVHIADVSHYVKEKEVLDREAFKRGTSVYLIDQVIPMLPKELSNGICSLNEGVNRLALSCLMTINTKGEVIRHRLAETVIKTNHRMTYTDVNALITNAEERITVLKEKYADVMQMLSDAEELALILRKKREERGAIDFDFPETEIRLDRAGRVKDITAYDRNEATKLIEEFMLIANETVAEDAFWQELPFLYRTHENPSEDKIKALRIFIQNFGYRLKKKNGKRSEKDAEIHPKEIQKLLRQIAGTPEEVMISRIALRSLKRAKYTTGAEGHFGLAAKYYTHFTSPIRRYPDLQIHRIIKENIHGRLTEQKRAHYDGILASVALQSGVLERRADEAEREVDKMKAAEFMSGKIGEVFEGIVSGISNWGVYVELPNTIEGMIRVSDLDGDYYRFDEERMELRGTYTGRYFQLGQKIIVEVKAASKESRTIDFKFLRDEEEREE